MQPRWEAILDGLQQKGKIVKTEEFQNRILDNLIERDVLSRQGLKAFLVEPRLGTSELVP